MSNPIAQQPLLLTSNPLIDTHDAVWSLLNSKTDFVQLFGSSPNPRQVRLDNARYLKSNPDSDDLAKAAFPRVRVAVTELQPLTERDSCSSECDATYEIQIWTGVQQQQLVLDASWVIYRAMLGWRQYARSTITWNGSPCICDVDARKVAVEWPELEGRGEGSDKRDSKGYEQFIAVWACSVHFYFKSTDLQGI